MTYVSLPGLGIDHLTIKEEIFSLFNGRIGVRWYGLIITIGIVVAFLYTCYRGKKNEGIKSDDVIDIGLLTVILGVIGARIYYVITDSGNTYDNFKDVIAIWNGGLGIYGGIIGGAIGALIMCYVKKINWRQLFDMATPGVMIAQAIGRWGNFCNGEAYGYEITDVSQYEFFNLKFELNTSEGTFFNWIKMGLARYEGGAYTYYHPTFLYESLWNVLGFVLINLFYKHKKFNGQVATLYFVWYGFGRMFLEGLRTDSLYITGTTLRISQCLGFLFTLAGVVILIVAAIMERKKKALAAIEAPYESQFFDVEEDEEIVDGEDEEQGTAKETEENEEPTESTEINSPTENEPVQEANSVEDNLESDGENHDAH